MTTFQKLLGELRRVADEVRLEVHLGGMEAKDLWAKLEPKVQKLEQEAAKIPGEMNEELTRMGADLKAQVTKLRERLGKDKDAKKE